MMKNKFFMVLLTGFVFVAGGAFAQEASSDKDATTTTTTTTLSTTTESTVIAPATDTAIVPTVAPKSTARDAITGEIVDPAKVEEKEESLRDQVRAKLKD